jgi:lysophospholipase L1-like esterase
VRRLGGLIVLAFVTLAAAQPAASACTEQTLCHPEALAPFFRALDEMQAGRRAAPVHVLQIGDSHTANEMIASPLRQRLQTRFGTGGRGVLPPGHPYWGFAPAGVDVVQSPGWRVEASFAMPARPSANQAAVYAGPPPFGLSGWRLTSETPGAWLTLDADAGSDFDRAVVCALARPSAGTLTLTSDETVQSFPLDGPATQPTCVTAHFPGPRKHLRLTADGGPVSILSWATFASGRGVAWSNLGVPGSQLRDFAARDDAMIAAELAAYAPDLIVLAYGTNDGFDRDVDEGSYESLALAQIERLKRFAPGAAILVVGPPDADRVRPDIPEDGKADAGFSCAPLTEAEARDYGALVAARSPALARWYPSPSLEAVREAQGRAADAEGVAFWNWGARLGGPCSAHRMSQADPREVRGDHIHFTAEGGERVADLLLEDILSARSAAPVAAARTALPAATPAPGAH